MSTKIYNGLRATSRHPFTVQARVKDILEPLFFAKFDTALEKAVSETGKKWGKVFMPPPRGSQGSIWEQPIPSAAARFEAADQLYTLVTELYRETSRTLSELDFGYEVVLLPNGNGVAQRPLVMVFSESGGNDYRKALVEAGVVTEYGYWNNTDQPDDVTDGEWAERRRAWEKLDTPREDGLFLEMPSRFRTAWEVRSVL